MNRILTNYWVPGRIKWDTIYRCADRSLCLVIAQRGWHLIAYSTHSIHYRDTAAEFTQLRGNINPFSAGTVFSRQNLTSVDVRFWRLKTVPAPKEIKNVRLPWIYNIGIQMEWEDIYKDFKLKKNFVPHGLCKNNSALWGVNNILPLKTKTR